MYDNCAACDNSTDSQLDSASSCIHDSMEGLQLRIALIFTCHFYFKIILCIKVFVADNGIVCHGKNLLFTFFHPL